VTRTAQLLLEGLRSIEKSATGRDNLKDLRDVWRQMPLPRHNRSREKKEKGHNERTKKEERITFVTKNDGCHEPQNQGRVGVENFARAYGRPRNLAENLLIQQQRVIVTGVAAGSEEKKSASEHRPLGIKRKSHRVVSDLGSIAVQVKKSKAIYKAILREGEPEEEPGESGEKKTRDSLPNLAKKKSQ